MRIAIDVSPIENKSKIAHRVRGTGFYIENLKNSLLKYFPENEYIFFDREEKLFGDVDIIHYPYFEPFFLTLPFRKKYKTVVIVHDLTPLVFPKNFPSGIKGRIKWEIQKRALKKADAIITDSQCSKNDIVKYTGVPASKVHVIYLAAGEEYKKVQSSKFNPSTSLRVKVQSLREKYNLPKEFALYVGDVTWNKNLPRLIEAVQKVKIPLVMVGKALFNQNYDKSNPWNQDLIKVQNLIKNDKNIICAGFVPTEDLVLLYNIATLFVMPSIYEGFGLPVLEAMQSGCPVVTSKSGSLKEITGNASYFVDAKDVDSIANGIKKVFSDKILQKKLSDAGLIQAKNFSWEKTATETVNIYRQILRY